MKKYLENLKIYKNKKIKIYRKIKIIITKIVYN